MHTVTTKRFSSTFKTIAQKSKNNLAKILYTGAIENPSINFLDLKFGDKLTISFLPNSRIKDNVDGFTSDGRQELKPGRAIKRLVGTASDDEIRELVALLETVGRDDRVFYVDGSRIYDYYMWPNVFSTSCYQGKMLPKWGTLFSNNPDKFGLIAYVENNTLRGRGIIVHGRTKTKAPATVLVEVNDGWGLIRNFANQNFENLISTYNYFISDNLKPGLPLHHWELFRNAEVPTAVGTVASGLRLGTYDPDSWRYTDFQLPIDEWNKAPIPSR